MKDTVDVLAIGAHPDDVELWVGGTICSLTSQGYSVAIVDLTQGELGSRGSVDTRREEAAEAAQILGVSSRENLEIPDGNIQNDVENRRRLIEAIRRLRPRTVLVGAPAGRHPDHPAATRLAVSAMYYSGLRRIETTASDGSRQKPHRPDHVLHYMQAVTFEPTLVVDVSDYWEQRTKAVKAFRSQFFNADYVPAEDEPETYVSNEDFLEWIEARARSFGYPVGARFAEPLLYSNGPLGVRDLGAVLSSSRRFR